MSEQRRAAANDELIARVRGAARQEQFLEVVSAEEAKARFEKHLTLKPLAAEPVTLAQALHRVLAADVVAAVDTTTAERLALTGQPAVPLDVDAYTAALKEQYAQVARIASVLGAVRK